MYLKTLDMCFEVATGHQPSHSCSWPLDAPSIRSSFCSCPSRNYCSSDQNPLERQNRQDGKHVART